MSTYLTQYMNNLTEFTEDISCNYSSTFIFEKEKYKVQVIGHSIGNEQNFTGTDYPCVRIQIDIMDENDSTKYSGSFYIRSYLNCCGIAIIYGLDNIDYFTNCQSLSYPIKQKFQKKTLDLIINKLFIGICQDLGYGSCQYVCTNLQDSLLQAFERSKFECLTISDGRIDNTDEDNDDDYKPEMRTLYLYSYILTKWKQ